MPSTIKERRGPPYAFSNEGIPRYLGNLEAVAAVKAGGQRPPWASCALLGMARGPLRPVNNPHDSATGARQKTHLRKNHLAPGELG